MEYVVGLVVGLAVGITGRCSGLDRDKAFYPTVLIVIATYYVLFAAMAPSFGVLVFESVVALGFSVAAIAGFRRNLWIVAGALGVHGLFDVVHASVVDNPGVPPWWPGFCAVVDVIAGAWLAALVTMRSTPTQRQLG